MPEHSTSAAQEYQEHVMTFMEQLPLRHGGGQEIHLDNMDHLGAAIGSIVMMPEFWRQSRVWDFALPDGYIEDRHPYLVLGAAELAPEDSPDRHVGLLLAQLPATRSVRSLALEHCVVPQPEWHIAQLWQRSMAREASQDIPFARNGYYTPQSLSMQRPDIRLRQYATEGRLDSMLAEGIHTIPGVAIDSLSPQAGHYFNIPRHVLRLGFTFDREDAGMATRNALVQLQNRCPPNERHLFMPPM